MLQYFKELSVSIRPNLCTVDEGRLPPWMFLNYVLGATLTGTSELITNILVSCIVGWRPGSHLPQQHKAGACEHGGGGSKQTSAHGLRPLMWPVPASWAVTSPAKAAMTPRRIGRLTSMMDCLLDISLPWYKVIYMCSGSMFPRSAYRSHLIIIKTLCSRYVSESSRPVLLNHGVIRGRVLWDINFCCC